MPYLVWRCWNAARMNSAYSAGFLMCSKPDADVASKSTYVSTKYNFSPVGCNACCHGSTRISILLSTSPHWNPAGLMTFGSELSLTELYDVDALGSGFSTP